MNLLAQQLYSDFRSENETIVRLFRHSAASLSHKLIGLAAMSSNHHEMIVYKKKIVTKIG